jgi:hypothetical protein
LLFAGAGEGLGRGLLYLSRLLLTLMPPVQAMARAPSLLLQPRGGSSVREASGRLISRPRVTGSSPLFVWKVMTSLAELPCSAG